MTNKKFKVGLDSRTGRVVHIDHVVESFEFAICPDCNSPLIASNRNLGSRIKATYFRHRIESNCSGETLIHLWGKQVIADSLCVLSAEYFSIGKRKDLARNIHQVKIRINPQLLFFQSCELEKTLNINNKFRVPDVTAKLKAGGNCYIEIFVNNAVDQKKAEFYRDSNLSCLEIDLSKRPPELSSNVKLFEDYVINTAPRKWICCSLYPDHDRQAQFEVEIQAKQATDETIIKRDKNRTAKNSWREQHGKFLLLIQEYLLLDNHKKVTDIYEAHLLRPETSSFNIRQYLESEFGTIPDMVNIQVKGELGFHCHRCVWQWEIYKRLVIDGFNIATKAKSNLVTRGYKKDYDFLAWYDCVPKWSPERLYDELLKAGIKVNRVCSETEAIVGEPIFAEKYRPKELKWLMVREWQEIPKPVCVIRRYLRELVRHEILETIGNDYVVKQGSEPPLCKSIHAIK
jgi:ssDNA-binding Zn-finger/Zn-ribbon topoisomerase 1